MDMDAAKPRAGGQESKRLEDIFDMLAQKDGKWIQIRVMPYECVAVGQHWIDIIGSKSKKEVRIPKMCVSFDGNTEEHKKGVKCPYCAVDEKFSPFYLMNVLVRSLQEDAPRKNRLSSAEKKSGIKDPDSESWTPIKVLRVPSSLMRKIQGLKDLNRDKATKKTYSVQHAEFGADINVKYDSKASGTDKYQAQLSDKCALTEEELGLLRYELDAEYIAEQLGRESPKEAAAEFKRMELVDSSKFDASADDDNSDDSGDSSEDLGSSSRSKGKSKTGSKSKSSSRSKSKDASDDSSDEGSGDDSEDSSDDKRGSRAKSKSKGSDDSDDSGDASDSGDSSDDSEDKPHSKASSKGKGKGKAAVSSSDDSDDSGDDSDDSGDDSDDSGDASDDPVDSAEASSDDMPRRSSSRSKAKSSDDADSSEDNTRSSSKRKGSSSSRSSKGSKSEKSEDKPSSSSRSKSGEKSGSSRRSSGKKGGISSDDIPF